MVTLTAREQASAVEALEMIGRWQDKLHMDARLCELLRAAVSEQHYSMALGEKYVGPQARDRNFDEYVRGRLKLLGVRLSVVPGGQSPLPFALALPVTVTAPADETPEPTAPAATRPLPAVEESTAAPLETVEPPATVSDEESVAVHAPAVVEPDVPQMAANDPVAELEPIESVDEDETVATDLGQSEATETEPDGAVAAVDDETPIESVLPDHLVDTFQRLLAFSREQGYLTFWQITDSLRSVRSFRSVLLDEDEEAEAGDELEEEVFIHFDPQTLEQKDEGDEDDVWVLEELVDDFLPLATHLRRARVQLYLDHEEGLAARRAEHGNADESAEDQPGYQRLPETVKLYLNEMGRVPLLDREGEIVLAKRMEAGELLVRQALLICPPVLTLLEPLIATASSGERTIIDVLSLDHRDWGPDMSREHELDRALQLLRHACTLPTKIEHAEAELTSKQFPSVRKQKEERLARYRVELQSCLDELRFRPAFIERCLVRLREIEEQFAPHLEVIRFWAEQVRLAQDEHDRFVESAKCIKGTGAKAQGQREALVEHTARAHRRLEDSRAASRSATGERATPDQAARA